MPKTTSAPKTITLDGKHRLSLADVLAVAGGARVALGEGALKKIRAARRVVEQQVSDGVPAYGITTGVGSQKDYLLEGAEIHDFNDGVIAAHATAFKGPFLPDNVLRAIGLILVTQYSWGFSGVRPELVERIVERLNDNDLPYVVGEGSLGVADLTPMAQFARGLTRPGKHGGREEGNRFPLEAKEGLSLMNNNAYALATGVMYLAETARVLSAFDLAWALSLEGFRGNPSPVCEAVPRINGVSGHRETAGLMARLLEGSDLWQPGVPRFLQDPLSFRCAPRVHGAVRQALNWAVRVWEEEMNSVMDNPIVDPAGNDGKGAVHSHGSVDSTLLTMAIDNLRNVVVKMAQIANERAQKLHMPSFSGLPVGLAQEWAPDGGVQYLLLGHVMASNVATVRQNSLPALQNTPGPQADGVEDHAGFAPHALEGLSAQLDALWRIAGLEAAIACWAIDRRELPAEFLGAGVRDAYSRILPHLPIGREGTGPFDPGPVVEELQALTSLPPELSAGLKVRSSVPLPGES